MNMNNLETRKKSWKKIPWKRIRLIWIAFATHTFCYDYYLFSTYCFSLWIALILIKFFVFRCVVLLFHPFTVYLTLSTRGGGALRSRTLFFSLFLFSFSSALSFPFFSSHCSSNCSIFQMLTRFFVPRFVPCSSLRIIQIAHYSYISRIWSKPWKSTRKTLRKFIQLKRKYLKCFYLMRVGAKYLEYLKSAKIELKSLNALRGP